MHGSRVPEMLQEFSDSTDAAQDFILTVLVQQIRHYRIFGEIREILR